MLLNQHFNKVCNVDIDNIHPQRPTLHFLDSSTNNFTPDSGKSSRYQQSESVQHEEIRTQQIDSLAEELRQTSLKNVREDQNAPVPKPRKHKARRNSDAGRWKITSYSIDNNTNNDHTSEFQCSQGNQSSVTREDHVSKFQQGLFSFQQNTHQATNSHATELCQTQSTQHISQQSLSYQDTYMVNSAGEQIKQSQYQENKFPEVSENQNQEKTGAMNYVPNFLKLLPKPKPKEDQKKIERRSSVACVTSNFSRGSRASSVESQSRPIFSFLRDAGQEAAPHRTRKDSALTSRRNSVASLQKYSSQEYLNQTSITNLKVRNAPVLLSGPSITRDNVQEGFLNKDGSLYQSTEHLNTSHQARSRHRSGSHSRGENYCWSQRSQLTGTGLRVGASVTEPEPKDGLAISKDGGFFMPFGNSENLSTKCKTRRQLKAEEQLRKQQEEEEELEREKERAARRLKRQEKRDRNRTMSLSRTNRTVDQRFQRSVDNKINFNVENNNVNVENKETSTQSENNSHGRRTSSITTEMEHLEILNKVSQTNEIENKTVTVTNTNNMKNEENSSSQRSKEWQQFGAEYNEYGELISCDKEPVGGHGDGWVWDGEKRDRSGAFWAEGAGYEGLTQGYRGLVGGRVTSGQWDNVRRDPIVHVSQDQDFVPDRFLYHQLCLIFSNCPTLGVSSAAPVSHLQDSGQAWTCRVWGPRPGGEP